MSSDIYAKTECFRQDEIIPSTPRRDAYLRGAGSRAEARRHRHRRTPDRSSRFTLWLLLGVIVMFTALSAAWWFSR